MSVQTRGLRVLTLALAEVVVLTFPLLAQTPDLSGKGRPSDRGDAASCFQTPRITTNTRRCAFFATD